VILKAPSFPTSRIGQIFIQNFLNKYKIISLLCFCFFISVVKILKCYTLLKVNLKFEIIKYISIEILHTLHAFIPFTLIYSDNSVKMPFKFGLSKGNSVLFFVSCIASLMFNLYAFTFFCRQFL